MYQVRCIKSSSTTVVAIFVSFFDRPTRETATKNGNPFPQHVFIHDSDEPNTPVALIGPHDKGFGHRAGVEPLRPLRPKQWKNNLQEQCSTQ